MNPLIKMAATQANGNMPGLAMIRKFKEFRKGWTDQSAQAKINEMLKNGQITNQQVEQARQMAEQIKGFMK